jgi:hypothetical protein
MSWVIPNPLQYVGQAPKGDGQCAVLAQVLGRGRVPLVALWRRGARVRGMFLPRGTVIAIFNSNGDYQGSKFAVHVSGFAHAALYVGQSSEGIEVVHQFHGCGHIRGALIRFGDPKLDGHKSGVHALGGTLEDDGNNYFVVEHK